MRQGKLSELIHNSGPSSSAPINDENLELLAPPAGSDFDDEMSSEEEVMTKKGKGKGKKGKGKKKVVVDETGLIGSCTVESLFRGSRADADASTAWKGCFYCRSEFSTHRCSYRLP